MGTTAMLVIIVILLLLSAFFSSAETALTTVNKIKMKTLADDGSKKAAQVLKLVDDPTRMLSAILIGNNIVNITASSMVTTLTIRQFQSISTGVATGLLTLYVLIFGEITPKSIAAIHSDKLALFYVRPISALITILTPVIFIINLIANGVLRLLHVDTSKREASITESELRTIVDVSHEEGVIESEERKMITNVVDFGDSVARDVMVPQIDIDFVSIDSSYDELIAAYRINKYTRMPVYEDDKDHVVGIINLKDVFFYEGSKENFSIREIMREPYFTYEFKKTSELFIEMKKESIPLAIVINEYGTIAGLLTLEDLIEEIVGEIRDEYDYDEEDLIKKLSPTDYLVDGYTKIDDINETLGLAIESDSYDSIAGHMIHLLDHIPSKGESILDDNVKFTVREIEKNRVSKILIQLPMIKPEETGKKPE